MDELRDAVGEEEVERADLDVDRAVRESGERTTPEASRSRLLFVVFAALGIMVAAIVALVLQSWIVLIVLLGVHALATAVIVLTVFRTTTEVEKPAPTTVAMLEEEGVDNPEGALNQLVEQAADRDEGGRVQRAAAQPREATDRTSGAADDVARQQESSSPGSQGGS